MAKEKPIQTVSAAVGNARPPGSPTNHDPRRTTTLIGQHVFAQIRDIQLSRSGPIRFDHGLLSTAAIAIVLDMANAQDMILKRAQDLARAEMDPS